MKLISLLWNNVFKYCKTLLVLIVLSCSVYAFALIPIWVQKNYVDYLTKFLKGDFAFGALLFWLILFYVTRAVSGGVLIPLAGAKDLYYEYSVTRNVRKSQHKINNATPLENYDSKEIYDLMTRAGQALTSGALRSTVDAIAAFLTMLISFVSMLVSLFVMHYSFLFFALILVFPIFIEYFWFQKRIYLIEKELVVTRRKQGFCLSHMNYKAYFFQTRISGTAPYFIGKWEDYRLQAEKMYEKTQKQKILFGFISGFIKSGCIIGMIIVGLYLLSMNKISIGSFSLLIGVIGMLISYMDFFINTLSQSIVRVSELKEVSAYYSLPQENHEDTPPSGIGDITLDNVSFKYKSRDSYALQNISKTFKKGEKVAILGVNGAGKTTLTNIIMGLYTPTTGNVIYGGVDIKDRDKTKWREKITVIFQDYQIHNLSITDNVYLGNTRQDKSDEKIKNAINLAGFPLDKFELDNMIGRNFDGIELSGGEAQKLAAARSYYNSDAEIIIIDEPTAALDPLAEEQLYQSFINNSEGKTLFIVSHRLGSVKVADRILVMDSSRILEDGTHYQLNKENGLYAKMYREQVALYNR
jgi:ATP-binding cassette subfamily B protein